MNNFLLKSLILCLLPFTVKANNLICNFSEPFIEIEYNSKNLTLRKIEYRKDQKVILFSKNNIRLIQKENSTFQLMNQNNQVEMTLIQNNLGTDGLSNTIYPFQANFENMAGGCESDTLPAFKTENKEQED